jgi:hypothetical protein
VWPRAAQFQTTFRELPTRAAQADTTLAAPPLEPASATTPAGAALSLVAPYLQLVKTAQPEHAPVSAEPPPPSSTAPPQPLVHGVPDAPARQMVQAVRQAAAGSGGDDRMTLAELTLISIASATQQIAASQADHVNAGAPAQGNRQREQRNQPPDDIDRIAREVLDAVRDLQSAWSERIGDPWHHKA